MASRQAAPNSGNLLLAVSTDGTIKVGLPPADYSDSFYDRAAVLGKLEKASHVICSPEGELFCVRDGDLYRGPLPSKIDLDWFSIARRVGKGEWRKVKILFFHQNGEMFCVTNNGEFYKGPQPDNENVSWMYGQATKIGINGWEQCEALCFHPDGSLYIVNKEDRIVTGKPPTTSQEYWDWLKSATVAGGCNWFKLTHFMAFDSDGKLWTVNKNNGNFYRGYIPSDGRYIDNAEKLGYSYHIFRFLSFTKDKTISSIIRLQFLPEQGQRDSQSAEVIAVQNFDNKHSLVPLKHNFTFEKTIKVSSSFSHQHGFTFAIGGSMKFTAGIPGIAQNEIGVTIDVSTTHEWNFTDTNETE
ncbi:tachylectin-2-like, partial [Hyla sarda]|uniref:tachylectin-2-like n=1 Tax=Hyla sarda TaxID=327740 RepID=UPI0024C22481